MRYTHILDLIEADLDRLRRAREILITSTALRGSGMTQSAGHTTLDEILRKSSHVAGPSSSGRKLTTRRTLKQKPAPATVHENLPSKPGTQAAAEPAAAITSNKPRLRLPRVKRMTEIQDDRTSTPAGNTTLRRRSMKSKSEIAPSTTALGGAVPAGPVFIPVEKVLLEKATREQEQKNRKQGSHAAEEVPFTAESLAQRWLGSRAS